MAFLFFSLRIKIKIRMKPNSKAPQAIPFSKCIIKDPNGENTNTEHLEAMKLIPKLFHFHPYTRLLIHLPI
jgi:hypothetical protein